MTGKNNNIYKPADAQRENVEKRKYRDEKKDTQRKDRSESDRQEDRR